MAVDTEGGSRPFAFVIVAPGTSLDVEAVRSHCRRAMAGFKVPVGVVALDEFPVTTSANGVKIQKSELREMARAALHS